MIRKAQIKLTLLYSAIFLLLFWVVSFGIYAWMNQFFGDHGRIHVVQTYQNEPNKQPNLRHEPPNDIVMDNLRNILIMIDFILLLTIPAITWFLTGNALEPVQKAHKREQQFLTDASHELRTPLSILRAQMEVALKKTRKASEYHEVIQSNKEEIEDLIALVENLLFISREQTKHASPINEEIDIADLIIERVATFQRKAQQKHLTIKLHPPENEIIIKGNQQLLKRLFTNLLDNAVKYTHKGSITIIIKQMKNEALIHIQDTGVGISKEHQDKIFDRFYRADESRSEQGYGLGLSIAQQIIEVHHGTITVNSEKNKGTEILIMLPIIKQAREKNLS
jgi:signal transduction histidine kinase